MYPSVEQGCEANANLVEPQIGHGLIGNSLFTFNNANKVFFASTQGKKRRIKVKAEILRQPLNWFRSHFTWLQPPLVFLQRHQD